MRLVERYEPDALANRVAIDPNAVPRTEWRGDGLSTFRAVSGVEDLRLEGGLLVGRTTDAAPVIVAERPTPVDPNDRLFAVEIRGRISAGTSLAVRFVDAVDPEKVPEQIGDLIRAAPRPVEPGDELQTWRIPAPLGPVTGEGSRHLLLRPSDAEGATFAFESLRAIFVHEHLASLPSGAGWHGLGEIYHQGVALRPGESLRLPADVPDGARLFVELGALAASPVRFRVALERDGAGSTPVLVRTLTTPNRWERARTELGRGRALVLSLESDDPHALGYFGAPVLRSPSPSLGERPRGVVLMLADTLRADHLALYDYARDTAPELTRRAAEGVLFRDAVAQGSWTKVSTPSLVTGLYQSSHGVKGFTDRLPDAAVTLAEIFRDAGYATVGYSSVFFTGKFSNMQQGYDSFHELSSLPEDSPKTARAFVDRFLAWLDDHPDVPFFAFLHVFDPHDPFEPRSPWNTLYADPARREQHLQEMETARPFIGWEFMRQRGLANDEELARAGIDPAPHRQHNIDWYDGSIRGMDAELARVFERLSPDDLAVFTSDHGEEFYEHGGVFHGETLYGEMIDVPLVFWGPDRVPAGAQVDATVQLIDVLPSLLELAGLPVPDDIQGRSLVPLMNGQPWTPRPAVAEAHPEAEGGPPSPRSAWRQTAIVSDGWKLIHNSERAEDAPEFELYRRERDPLDQLELSSGFPTEIERLRNELEAWRTWVATIRLEGDGEAAELTPEELERLRGLGYVQ